MNGGDVRRSRRCSRERTDSLLESYLIARFELFYAPGFILLSRSTPGAAFVSAFVRASRSLTGRQYGHRLPAASARSRTRRRYSDVRLVAFVFDVRPRRPLRRADDRSSEEPRVRASSPCRVDLFVNALARLRRTVTGRYPPVAPRTKGPKSNARARGRTSEQRPSDREGSLA